MGLGLGSSGDCGEIESLFLFNGGRYYLVYLGMWVDLLDFILCEDFKVGIFVWNFLIFKIFCILNVFESFYFVILGLR